MIHSKRCSAHPDEPALIIESNHKSSQVTYLYPADAICIECDRHLEWVARKELINYRFELQTEIDRLDLMLAKFERQQDGAEDRATD